MDKAADMTTVRLETEAEGKKFVCFKESTVLHLMLTQFPLVSSFVSLPSLSVVVPASLVFAQLSLSLFVPEKKCQATVRYWSQCTQ